MIGQWAHGGWLMDCIISQAGLLAGTQKQTLYSCHCTQLPVSLCEEISKQICAVLLLNDVYRCAVAANLYGRLKIKTGNGSLSITNIHLSHITTVK